jgi:hypothetical protein
MTEREIRAGDARYSIVIYQAYREEATLWQGSW